MTESTTDGTMLPPIVVLGATGQVGSAVVGQLRTAGRQVFPLTRADIDLADSVDVVRADFQDISDAILLDAENAVVINVAAWTGVDSAEEPANSDAVWKINAYSPAALAEVCAARGWVSVFVSTDYVFGEGDGQSAKAKEYPAGLTARQTSDKTEPLNVYGESKSVGERGVLDAGGTVVRTSWVFSGPSGPGRDFVDTMMSLAKQGITPSVVDDQFGRPTYSEHLATGLIELCDRLASEKNGEETIPRILHATGGGPLTTWCEFAQEIFAATGQRTEKVTGILTSEYPTPAVRPRWSYLDISSWTAAGLTAFPAWQEGLREALR